MMAYVDHKRFTTGQDCIASAAAVRARIMDKRKQWRPRDILPKCKPTIIAAPYENDDFKRYVAKTAEYIEFDDYDHSKERTIKNIIKAVSDASGVSIVDIHSRRRHPSVVLPRQIAMFCAKQITGKSLLEIGRKIAKLDHTTILHGIKKIDALRQTDPSVQIIIDRVLLNFAYDLAQITQEKAI